MPKKFYYIENVHNAPITCTAKDKNTKLVLFEKKFYPAMTEKWSGKQLATGYTKLTEQEYKQLCEFSPMFIHYKDNKKGTLASPLLVLHEELPPEAKLPSEALADARRENRKANEKINALNAEITTLKAQLLDEQNKYRTLESASTDEEKLKPLNDTIKKYALFVSDVAMCVDKLATIKKVDADDVKKFCGEWSEACKKLAESEQKDFD
jgi:hypothetical protein